MMEKQPPKQIYLQAYDSDSYDDNTWCSDKQNEDDIEYILQSEYDQLKSENERLQKYKEKLISDATQNEFVLLAYHDSLKEMKARVQELEQERRWIHQDKTMIAKKDGDSWCFVLPDFVNLHESEAEFVDGILYRFIEEIYKRLLPPKEEK